MSEQIQVLISVLHSLKEPLFVLGKDGTCLFANRSFLKLLGLSVDSSQAIEIATYWPALAKISNFTEEFLTEFRLASGEDYVAKLSIQSPSQDCYICRVLSAQSKTDPATTFHSQRLETLGILAGVIAHDFNNILMGIIGHTTYLKTILPAAGLHEESLAAITEGTKKGTQLTQQILNFSKLDTGNSAEPVDVGALILRTCNLLRRAIPNPTVLETLIEDTEVQVLCIESQLAQILVNLIFNARDALKENGKIQVGLTTCDDQKKLKDVFGGLDLSSKEYAVLSVTDNGHGVPKDIVDKIFEPYFSTKKDKGTGLGLSTVAAIVKSLGGIVKVHSAIEVGTIITLYVPCLPYQPQKVTQDAVPETTLPKGTEHILVVDDEYPVRNVLVISLQHLGYKVESASSGAEALELFRAHHGKFDLIITDMLMPNMSGDELFFELKKLSPDIKALIISGFTSEESIKAVLQAGGKGFLPKPFTIDELARRVRTALDVPL